MTERVWKTADGRKIKFENLADSHLDNIITSLQRGEDMWGAKYTAEARAQLMELMIERIARNARYRKLPE